MTHIHVWKWGIPLRQFKYMGERMIIHWRSLEIFELGISDFSMNPSGSRSVVLWDRSADAKLRRGGRRRHDLKKSLHVASLSLSLPDEKSGVKMERWSFFCVWINFWVFTIGPMYQWKQLLISHVEKCSLKNPRRSFFGMPENPQVEKSRRCGENSPGQCDLLFPLSTHWQEHSRAGAWFNPAV